jgi:DNA-binding HxlR family transcriptional regulator
MKTERRSPCPVACSLDILGDKWTLLVIRDLACGKTSFKDFCQSPEKIATNTLADRLVRLETAKLIETVPVVGHPTRLHYQLTAKGRTLMPILEAIKNWGLEHIPGTEARMKPV